MEVSEKDLLSLVKTLEVLTPYLDEIVIIGGWVPFLYRKYGQILSRHPSVRTTEIDVAVPTRVEERGRPTINELLLSEGYGTTLYGSDFTVVKYVLASLGAEIEFLTPEVGRPGREVRTVQRGLAAQSLRYLNILLDHTKEIKISDNLSGQDIDLVVKVPSPGAFVYQKGLVLPRRRPSKRPKDLYYIFDILDSPGESRDSILREIHTLRECYPNRWFTSFIRILSQYFLDADAEGPALIATQYSGTMPLQTFRNYAHRTFRDFIKELHKTTL